MSRTKRLLKWTGIVLGGLVAVLLIANAVFVWRTDTALERRLEAIRADGEPLMLADLARDPVPPEFNAHTYLQRAAAGIEGMGEFLDEVFRSETYQLREPTEAELARIRAAFTAYPQVLPLLQQAAEAPDYDPGYDYTQPTDRLIGQIMERLGARRAAIRVLDGHALLCLAEDRHDEAFETSLAMLRLARHVAREPMVVGNLVSHAIRSIAVDSMTRVLRAAPISENRRAILEADLAAFDDVEVFRHALVTERVLGIESYRQLPSRNVWLYLRGYWNLDVAYYLDLLEASLATADRTYADATAAMEAVSRPVAGGLVLVRLFEPALDPVRRLAARSTALTRCLRVLNALQAFEEEHPGAVPELADLGLPAEAITDPFTGEPLRMRRLPEGWLIYSVGENLTDNGGAVTAPSGKLPLDIGLGP